MPVPSIGSNWQPRLCNARPDCRCPCSVTRPILPLFGSGLGCLFAATDGFEDLRLNLIASANFCRHGIRFEAEVRQYTLNDAGGRYTGIGMLQHTHDFIVGYRAEAY